MRRSSSISIIPMVSSGDKSAKMLKLTFSLDLSSIFSVYSFVPFHHRMFMGVWARNSVCVDCVCVFCIGLAVILLPFDQVCWTKNSISVVCVMKILVLLVWLSEHNRKFKHAIWLYFWWQWRKKKERHKWNQHSYWNAFFRKLIRHSFEILRTRNFPFVAWEVVSILFLFFFCSPFFQFFLTFSLIRRSL